MPTLGSRRTARSAISSFRRFTWGLVGPSPHRDCDHPLGCGEQCGRLLEHGPAIPSGVHAGLEVSGF